MEDARIKLEQLAYLASNTTWTDALEKAWITSLAKALPNITDRSLEYIPAMLLDHHRTKFYQEILPKTVHNKKVLEIGTGAGALAVAAIKNGAKHVIALECNPNAIPIAKQTFQRNGVSEKVTLLEKSSLDLKQEEIEGCEVVIHDLFGRDPFGELACELLAHARSLLPRARFVPEGFILKVSMISRLLLPSQFHPLPNNDQIDLSALERARKDQLIPAVLTDTIWNKGIDIFNIHFKDCKPLQTLEESIIGPSTDQVAVVWFEIFDGDNHLKSWGPDSANHWGQLIWLPPTGARQIKFTQSPTCLRLKAI
ncbi:MAG: hypothetical protein COW01_14140 [Bdellovibrionales bacterium CG12_big_fil_rev_8_21_14_0_65_38_15]|nr:MAG: hypothetical protein COW79_16960 [Bdellovibrionales bacterium CG22_combo_CG10-13_8_21_14_all_38_13]PIQ53413.1 MAG: hypothetical protein COW01_14140 [Bdellovibrionales bacterium CG12_big_fil_rev_8_21_14_0_65_38_15]PIR30224.1 MAG: hypothetical protein COV38_05615 [Bdellovibrionales bacterium CG11_big_fil_rev_8_21_14_0_20_38_13]